MVLLPSVVAKKNSVSILTSPALKLGTRCKTYMVMLPKPEARRTITKFLFIEMQANCVLYWRETHWLEQGAQACEQALLRA